MSFVQIIEYETDRPAEVEALMRESSAQAGEAAFSRLVWVHDRDRPSRYLVMVEFASHEQAMANSARPETSAMAASLSALCSSGPRYYNLDVLASLP